MRYIEQLFEELEQRLLSEPRMQEAIAELQSLIRTRYPQATFAMGIGDDPFGIHITITVDVEDTDEVEALFEDRLRTFELEEGLPIYPVVVQPLERSIATLRQRQKTALSA